VAGALASSVIPIVNAVALLNSERWARITIDARRAIARAKAAVAEARFDQAMSFQ
jgi:hypothetical protein